MKFILIKLTHKRNQSLFALLRTFPKAIDMCGNKIRHKENVP